MAIGKNLKEITKRRGMSLKELAEKSGIPLGTIYNITKNDPDSISSRIMSKLCECLDISTLYASSGCLEKDKDNVIGSLLDLSEYRIEIDKNERIFIIHNEEYVEITSSELDTIKTVTSAIAKFEIESLLEKYRASGKIKNRTK